MSDALRPRGLQHTRLPCPSPPPGVYSNSCPLSQWCHPTISSSVTPFPPCPQSLQHQSLFQWVDSLYQMAKGLELQYYISDIRRTEYCSQASSVHVIHFSTCTHTHVCTHAHTHTHTHTHNTHMLLPTYLWVLTGPLSLGLCSTVSSSRYTHPTLNFPPTN